MTLGRWTLLMKATRLCPEAVITMMCHLSFKAAYQRYKSLDIYKDGYILEKNFAGAAFQILPMDYHTWVCPIFILEDTLKGDLSGIPRW